MFLWPCAVIEFVKTKAIVYFVKQSIIDNLCIVTTLEWNHGTVSIYWPSVKVSIKRLKVTFT